MTYPLLSVDAIMDVATMSQVYFFRGAGVMTFDASENMFTTSTLEPLAQSWPNLPSEGGFADGDFDAAWYRSSTGIGYFAKSNLIAAYDLRAKQPLSGFPKTFAATFPGLPDVGTDGIDAALYSESLDMISMFRGADTITVNASKGTVVRGSMRGIAEVWKGWPSATAFGGGVDAAYLDEAEQRAYFFRASVYLVYDVATHERIEGPKQIGVGWPMAVVPPTFAQFEQMTPGLQVDLVAGYMEAGVLEQVLEQIYSDSSYTAAVNAIVAGLRSQEYAERQQWQARQRQD